MSIFAAAAFYPPVFPTAGTHLCGDRFALLPPPLRGGRTVLSAPARNRLGWGAPLASTGKARPPPDHSRRAGSNDRPPLGGGGSNEKCVNAEAVENEGGATRVKNGSTAEGRGARWV